MDLQKMQYFKDVFELNSFTKAADKNFVYQSAVTQQIAALEKELGVQLFIREHGGIKNTLEGEIFYEECIKILSEYAVLRNKLKDIYEGEKHHPYTVGLFGSIPDITSNAARLTPIDGLMPDPTKPIPGCRFADRCPHCMEICNTKAPGMADFDGHQIKCFLYLQDDKNGGEGK